MTATLRSRVSVAFSLAVGLAVIGSSALTRRSAAAAAPAGIAPQSGAGASSLKCAVVALDSQRKAIAGLQAGDFSVRTNDAPREVVSATPGDKSGRTFLVIIDRNSVENADAQSAATVARGLVDALPPQDGIELVLLPAINRHVTPTLDRAALRAALSKVTGRFQDVSTSGGDVFSAASSGGPALTDARARAAEFLTDVAGYLDDLRGTGGPVIVVLLSNRVIPGSWNEPEVDRTAAAAAALGAPIYVLPLYGERWTHEGAFGAGMRMLAERTGGAVFPVVRDPAGAARKVLEEASGLYVLEIAPSPSDNGDSPADLKVALRRPPPSMRLRAPTRLMIPLPRGAIVSTFLAGARPNWATVGIRPRDLRLIRDKATNQADPAAMELVARAGDLIEQCARDSSLLAADEHYDEHVKRDLPGRQMPFRDRVLQSQFILANVPSLDETWMAFRDVIDVDGTPVTDWEHRLETAFSGLPEDAAKESATIDQRGLRFHIGTLTRATVSPALPLLFLHKAHRARFRFELRGQDKVDGVAAQRIDYAEQSQPTLARARRNNGWNDVRSQGSFWIDPATGRVLKATLLWDEGMFLKTELTATYAASGATAVVPLTLKEVYSTLSDVAAPGLLIEANARYTNWRTVGKK